MHCDLKARFAYGHLIPWIRTDGQSATLTSGPDALAFSSPVPVRPDWDVARVEADFVVRVRRTLDEPTDPVMCLLGSRLASSRQPCTGTRVATTTETEGGR